MSGIPSQRVKYAAMASAAVLIVGAGAAALIDNREIGIDDTAAGPSGTPTRSVDTGGTPSSPSTPDPEGTSDGGGPSDPTSTLWGAAFEKRPGEGYRKALRRTDTTMGRLDVLRVYYRRVPKPWPGKAPGRDVIVSFRLDPLRVLAGDYDDYMRDWFASVPIGVNVWWTNHHEPEDDIDNGKFTAREFRASFEHLDRLAYQAANPRLRSTVILMSWSARPASGRNWRSYVPNPASIDVLAWDIYNRRHEVYPDPAALLEAAKHDSETIGKPFAVAELASVLGRRDNGTGRAEWLRAMGAFAQENDAEFVSYFNILWNSPADDFRLMDAPSIEAWREISGN